MADLVEFAKRIERQLARVNREPHWTSDEAQRYMTDVAIRRQRYEQLAARLSDSVIRPRLRMLASHFAHASPTNNEPPGRTSYWFGYCERFPSSTNVAFAIEHDARFEKVSVRYEMYMVPTFIKFEEHDKLTMELDAVDDARVANWVEERLLEFLDIYLQIDRGSDDLEDDTATDPVCGMRISRSSAVASADYTGHLYHFCSVDCEAKFTSDPTRYVRVKAM